MKAWLEQFGSRTLLRKLVIFVLVLFIGLFVLNWFLFAPHTSPFSATPSEVPREESLMMVDMYGLDADFFYSKSQRPQKAVVLLGGSEGGRYWSYHPDFIQELVNQGFCVLSLAYFGTNRLPKNLRAIPLEYFRQALLWLSSQKNLVISDNYAVVGVSRGAELALLLGSRYPEVKAVVAIDPSSVVFPGPPTSLLDAIGKQHSAWSEKGRELPFVRIPYSWTTIKGMASGKRTRMFQNALEDTSQVNAAAIPAEQIRGPVLLVSFKYDQIWPSPLMCEQIAKRLRDSSFNYYFEHADYNGGHSDWSITACHKNILTFLNERFLKN
jgi:pimeloyl-ACP methyl ester carboxylesterase